MSRFVKVIDFTYTKSAEEIENAVNDEVDKIVKNGGKVVTIFSKTFGLSPMKLIYTIVYESEKRIVITDKIFKENR